MSDHLLGRDEIARWRDKMQEVFGGDSDENAVQIDVLCDMAEEALALRIAALAGTPLPEALQIDSAPKDKNGILAYSPSFYQGRGGWVAAVWMRDGWHANPGGWRFEPTHWIPFPSAPSPPRQNVCGTCGGFGVVRVRDSTDQDNGMERCPEECEPQPKGS